MLELYDQVQEATQSIQARWSGKPRVGIILGTGPGRPGRGDRRRGHACPTRPSRISLCPRSSRTPASSSAASWRARPWSPWKGGSISTKATRSSRSRLPVRVMKALGCEVLIVSNACGGMNPQFAKGDIMVIEDHINLLGDNPLIGRNDDRLGPRFPDMCWPYDRELIALAQRIALEEKIACHKGVFVAVPGPNLETRAEYRFLRAIGADVVGMSTVPEVIVAVHCGLRSVGFSIVTDLCLPDALEPASVPDIIATANAAEKKLRVLVSRLVQEL